MAIQFCVVSVLAGVLVLSGVKKGFSQDTATEELFIDLGPISYSSRYTLGPDTSHITFVIKNQTTRTIDKLYAWIYIYTRGTALQPKGLVLVNNPHKGGTVTKGKPHRSGEIAEWRFPLNRTLPSTDANEKFTLRVSIKGIFYPKVELPPPIRK
ncbi:hypothetical protein UR09_01590 [Candidatus Nitromaritima sp. SCGC AAA799-A02]|nr:hypothetical protein UZ36_05270 [Candidatus Nitromaritima sp. SCGC AAA799-C22]KMP12232.1 hypothetical protein UR09_01590 [Candidatus Nitromaritima sp. SCGC AAA799-A02]